MGCFVLSVILHFISPIHLSQVCHHEDCQETNDGNPLLLCLRCDEVHHLGAGSNHARFDVPGKIPSLFYTRILFTLVKADA